MTRNQQIVSLYQDGLSFSQIAAQIGVTRNVIAGVMHRSGINDPSRRTKVRDISGKKFGRLLAISRVERNRHGATRWLCQCECGKMHTTEYGSLVYGRTKSCGCLKPGPKPK